MSSAGSRYTEQLVESSTAALSGGVQDLLKQARLLTAIGEVEDRTWAPYARNIEDSLQSVARILGRTKWSTVVEPETHESLLTRAMNERRLVRVFVDTGSGRTKVRFYEPYGWRYKDGETRSHVWVWNVDNNHPEMLKVNSVIGVELRRETFEPREKMYDAGGK